jgi:hypothetical protein
MVMAFLGFSGNLKLFIFKNNQYIKNLFRMLLTDLLTGFRQCPVIRTIKEIFSLVGMF